jgi:alkanesulfonate monooxygenase SsuD/methylene tetrahydromethanopterin reductase-like flavin-dependent oxidoreductase (luciferase family)
VFPKPTAGVVPIALGNWGPLGMGHAAAYADHWMPIDQYLTDADGNHDVAAGIERFRHMVATEGRDPDAVPVSLLLFSRPKPARIERYAELGVKRLVASVPSADVVDADFVMRDLDAITPLVEQYRS